MFTGIIESIGRITGIRLEGSNMHLTVASPVASELKIDQSMSHNGICLTVVSVSDTDYTVTAIEETINKTTVGAWNVGDTINLERGMKLSARLDGHIVQGHVDQTGVCTAITENDGSWKYTFSYDPSAGNVTIEKGSITVNGVSLTVVDSEPDSFSVAVIPYTYKNTTFHNLRPGTRVNLEFDVIGKYVARLMRH